MPTPTTHTPPLGMTADEAHRFAEVINTYYRPQWHAPRIVRWEHAPADMTRYAVLVESHDRKARAAIADPAFWSEFHRRHAAYWVEGYWAPRWDAPIPPRDWTRNPELPLIGPAPRITRTDTGEGYWTI